MKKLLAIILIALLVLSFAACGEEEETDNNDLENAVKEEMTLKANAENTASCFITYDVNEEGTYEITGINHDGVSPLHIKISAEELAKLDREITGIADEAFKSCKNLVSIEMPETITYIGKAAFYGCEKLTSIVIPKSVTLVKNNAFEKCVALTAVTAQEGEVEVNDEKVMSGLVTIEANAFKDCAALTAVSLPATTLKTISDGAFMNCKALTEFTVSTSVKTIGSGVFMNCEKLMKLIALGNPDKIADPENADRDYLFSSNMNVTMTVTEGSTLEAYAIANGINYLLDGADDPYYEDV